VTRSEPRGRVGSALEVVRAGALTTVQDRGRRGYAHLGVPGSGNALVGNVPDAAGLEFTLTGGVLLARGPVTVAVTGAPPRRLRVGGRTVGYGTAVAVAAGETIEIGAARAGLRTYLAVAGGIAVAPVLGSRSTDVLAGLGPPVVRDGVLLPVGRAPAGPPPSLEPVAPPVLAGAVVLRVWPGPRLDWFTDAARETFFAAEYVVSPLSNRVAVRLTGPPLERARSGELPSEGLVLGAVQVPASGEPLVFLADHPTTGGYPVLGVVDAADLPTLAQCRPGRAVRFTHHGGTSGSQR
jgi:biotin-dependent carboxylase-like uncharacterized protein